MGDIAQPAPVLLLVAVTSRHDEALDWAREKGVAAWGPIALESELFAFVETDYYAASMGADLRKCFWAFQRLVDPGSLGEGKLLTNHWEVEYAGMKRHTEPRPLNLDPGYLTQAKLVLASTKDHAHRIYLSRGIFAEVTLQYKSGQWHELPWTYPDYRRSDYQAFFSRCRDYLRQES